MIPSSAQLTICLLGLFSFLAGACPPDTIAMLDAHEFYIEVNRTPGAVVIDVRTVREYNRSRIPGAVLAGKSHQLFELTDSLGRDYELFIYCEENSRSLTAGQLLSERGFHKVYILKEGIRGWRRSGLPVEKGKHPKKKNARK